MNSLLIASNIVRRSLGKKKSIVFFLLLPSLVVALVIGLLGSMSDHSPKVVYVNEDRGGLGEQAANALADTGSIVLERMETEEEAGEFVKKGKADAAILIPSSFGDRILKGERAGLDMVQMRMDEGTMAVKLQLEQTMRDMETAAAAARAVLAGQSDAELRLAFDRIWRQQERKQVDAVKTDLGLAANPAATSATGMLFLFMLGLVTSSIASLIDDRKNKTVARTFTAPVRAIEIAAGNFLGSFALGTLQTLLVLLFSRYVLRFDYGVGFWPQFLIIEFFLLAALGLGCSVAGLVKNPNNLSSVNALVVTPTCMLGGCFWPVEMTPPFMQKLSYIVPQRWAIDALQKLSAGDPIADVSLNLVILALFAVILLGFGSVVLKPNET